MKTAVAETSLRVYRAKTPADLNRSESLIVGAMHPHKTYTRRELESLSGLRPGSVCGRVADLILGGVIKTAGEKICSESGKQVEALQLAQCGDRRHG